jgi:hypothetical protein
MMIASVYTGAIITKVVCVWMIVNGTKKMLTR